MPVRQLTVRPRRSRRQIWDSLTISLAIAVVILGITIFLMPKPASRTETSPKSQKPLPATMAYVAPALHSFTS